MQAHNEVWFFFTRFLKKEGNILPVVLLDEIGLAEVSPNNPLKVLHSLLEPGYPKDRPDVAVVGISNWALDGAKMNRAIVLSRPEPEVHDLQMTAKAIQESILKGSPNAIFSRALEDLAAHYHAYSSDQPVQNFHGLRDFYSLIKSLCRRAEGKQRLSKDEYQIEFTKSFGGLDPTQMCRVIAGFLGSIDHVYEYGSPIQEVIKDCVADRTSRHLMLITQGDLQLDILESLILGNVPHAVMYGSAFPEDETEHYSYRYDFLMLEVNSTILALERQLEPLALQHLTYTPVVLRTTDGCVWCKGC